MKLRKIVKVGATVQYEQSYLGGLEYRKNGTGSTRVEAVYHAEGRYLNLNAEVNNTLLWQKEYTLKDHLGNARISFTDKNANGIVDVPSDIVQENHYYPFGLNYEGAWRMNDAVARDTRYQYNGKEWNDDFGLNWNDYGFRYYDPTIGRFTGVDPIADKFAHATPYNYAENEPIANIDLWGLQKVSIHSASFAPFNTFGGPFKGDGDNRKFSTDPNASSRISGQINLNASKDGISLVGSPIARGSESHNNLTGGSTYSEAEISTDFAAQSLGENSPFSAGANLSFHLKGNNDLVPISPDIDTKGDLGIGLIESKDGGSTIMISGSVFGDKFPANETFLRDQSGVGVFLGVSGADGNPYTSLPLENSRTMSEFTIGINFDSKGNISGVTANGTKYSVEDWNAKFKDLSPKDGNVSTKY